MWISPNDECAICLDPVSHVALYTCGHGFCDPCATACALNRAFCPVCDQPIYRVDYSISHPQTHMLHPHSTWGISCARMGCSLIVDSVAKGSSAEREGIIVGDQILHVDDLCVASLSSSRLQEYLDLRQFERRFVCVTTRRRKTITISKQDAQFQRCSKGCVVVWTATPELEKGAVVTAVDGDASKVRDLCSATWRCFPCCPELDKAVEVIVQC